ncbi:MAG: DMT family transporter [Alphaproteobacteria bacterium]|nr:DMT family transporter [Alphaproteobacteria bacterium]
MEYCRARDRCLAPGPPPAERQPSSREPGPMSNAPSAASAIVAPDPFKGVMWMLAACVFFTAMGAMVRHTTEELHAFEVVFFRSFFGFLVMLPWLARVGLGVLRTSKLNFYLLRCSMNVFAMCAFFWGVGQIPLATAFSLSFTAPLFVTLLAILVLGEHVRLRRMLALVAGFSGILIILRPGLEAVSLGALAILFSSTAWAIQQIIIKVLARTESPAVIVAYMGLLNSPLALIPALFFWTWPTVEQYVWLVGIGGLGTLGHLAITRAYAYAEATQIQPFDFTRLPLAALVGYFAFGEVPDVWTWVGGVVIAAASVYIARREVALRRARRAAT